MDFTLTIDPKETTDQDAAALHLVALDGTRLADLDIEFKELARIGFQRKVAFDLLLLAACVYAIDKRVPRSGAEDSWTRELSLTLPVSDPALWEGVRTELEACLSFLSGDRWQLSFTKRDLPIIRPKKMTARRLRKFLPTPSGNAVCLFSGGLDSLVGALDWLETHPQQKVLLVGHRDGQMPGPQNDQKLLLEKLRPMYPGRTSSLIVKVGHTEESEEITLRSRSFLFVALGVFAAGSLSPERSLVIPENGTIALNVPLTPSRRGSCSTRTTHPFYLKMLGHVLRGLGLNVPLANPLEAKTKGEVVSQCANLAQLRVLAPLSVSCAKRGHKKHFVRREAKGCGRCMPCIYRRASLHTVGLDTEDYGSDICRGEVDITEHDKDGPNDLRACFSFLTRNPTVREIERMLLGGGSLDVRGLDDYALLVTRAMDEIRQLLRDKGTSEVKRFAGVK
jgi:hypothetical protein